MASVYFILYSLLLDKKEKKSAFNLKEDWFANINIYEQSVRAINGSHDTAYLCLLLLIILKLTITMDYIVSRLSDITTLVSYLLPTCTFAFFIIPEAICKQCVD